MELSEYHREVARTFPSDGQHEMVDASGLKDFFSKLREVMYASNRLELRKKLTFYGRAMSAEQRCLTIDKSHDRDPDIMGAMNNLEQGCTAGGFSWHRLLAGAHALAGLGGEMHEVLVALMTRSRGKLVSEIGDALFYVTALCNATGITLDEAMAANVAKLRARYPDGFSAHKAVNRDVVAETAAMGGVA